MESKPTSSAVRAMSPSVLPILAGPAGQVKSAMSSPIFIAPQGRISANPMNPVLCIRNDRDATLGITAGALAEAAVPLVPLDAFEASARWAELDEIGGLIVFGGEMNVDETDRHPHLLTQRELMRRAVDAGLSVLGFKRVRLTDEGERDVLLGAFRPAIGFSSGTRTPSISLKALDAQGVEAWLRVSGPTPHRVLRRTADEIRD